MHYYFMRKINKEYMNGTKVYNEKIILGISLGFLALGTVFMILYTNAILRYIALIVISIIISFNISKITEIFKKIRTEKNS